MEQVNPSVDLQDTITGPDTKALWVFGYGSLCWNPGFHFDKAVVGYICGYSRKFWQGNNTHRGTQKKPGRVATLIEHQDGTVHGVAFQISGDAALPYLAKRECKLGGYSAEFTTFFPSLEGPPLTVMVYIATSKNSLWLGDAPLIDIAKQIADCSGPSGHNVEYLLRLADFMRLHFPKVHDEHLFHLETLVKDSVREQKKCLETLMGDGKIGINFIRRQSAVQYHEDQEERTDSFQFTARIPEKNLRCLNI